MLGKKNKAEYYLTLCKIGVTMNQTSIGKKLLKIFAVIFTVILLLALTAPYWGSRLVRLYRDKS